MSADFNYLFVRTKVALRFAEKEIAALEELDYWETREQSIQKLNFGDGAAWEDGLVLRLPADEPFYEYMDYCEDKFTDMDAWALHDGAADCVERPMSALMEKFFHDNGGSSTSQIFVRYDPDSIRDKALVDDLRAALDRKTVCKPAFHFRNGVVLLAASNEPAKVTFGRCQRIAKGLPGFLFIDPWGETFAYDGPCHDAWSELSEAA